MGNKGFKTMLKVFVFLSTVLSVSSAFAATYYVDQAAANDSGTGSATSPKKYIVSGIQLMSSGDTLVLRDGVYTGINNTIGDLGSPQTYLPSGSAGNFTTLKADHVGQAILDGQYNTVPFAMANGPTYRNYLHIDGIHFRHGNNSVFSISGSHNWVSNCGFEDGQAYSDNSQTPIAFIGGDSAYNLVEDCWVWGKGRYGFYTSDPHSAGSTNNIFRRLVVRLDASPTNWMSSGLRFYSSHNGAMQNCIVLDSLTGSNSGDGGTCAECWSYAQGGGSSDGEWGHIFNSNIALNNPQRPAFTNEAGNSNSPETWTNSVWWDTQYGMLVYANLATVNTWNISNMLMGGTSPSKVFGDALYYGGNRNENITLSNSIIANSSASSYGQPGISLARNISNTDVYNDVTTACNSGDGCSNSGQTTSNPFTSVVKYLPRTEGGTQGPTIMYQVGGTGTFYGDSGWNNTSTNQLWPYANEAIWAAKMKAYNVNTVSGNRGFAALAGSSQTPLTDYIWGYLGNPKPDIYGAGSTGDTTAPTVSLTAPGSGSAVSGTVSVTANATDNVGVTKVEFYVNGSLAATDTATPYLYSWNTSGLAAGSYTLSAKAYDAANNVGQSGSVTVTLASDTTAPVAAISAPANGASVSGTVTVTASATDNVGVAKVELYGNGTLLTASNVSPLSYSWNSASVANGSYTLTAKAYDAAGNVGQASSTVTVNNGTGATSTGSTIWPATATPAVTDQGADNAAELGVKFRSDVNGSITGARFYKASTNTGTHVANLWSSSGALLATATYSNETASGWQSVNFPTPVAITANTVYVVSYHANAGHYANDQAYFSGKGYDNAPLHALADGVSGSNGVYAYGSTSSFPNSSWNASNYWVAPVMTAAGTTTSGLDTTAPTVSISSPASGATVSGTLSVTASAADNVGVSKVEFYVNGTLKTTATAGPYAFAWDTTSVGNGTYTLSAKAYDAAGNVGTSANVSVNVSNASTVSVPIAFVQVANTCPSSASKVALAYGKSQTKGNLNVVVVGWNDTSASVSSVTDSAGNVYSLAAGTVTGAGQRQAIYYAKGIAGGSTTVTVTFSTSASAPDVRILEYAGVSALDKTTSSSGSGSTASTGSVTTTTAKELLVAANTVATGNSGAGSGYTARVVTYPDSDLAEDRIVSATGSYSASAPLTSSGSWVMQLVTFK